MRVQIHTKKTISISIFVKNTNSLSSENPIGEPFFQLSEVDSSNNYAMRRVQAQLAVHGTTWFAHFQNAGKGQRGKLWNAEPGQNIMMSIVLQPKLLAIDNQFVLNAAVALACFDFFKKYAVEKTYIKWPNDIFWEDRKAGGILVESVIKGNEWKYAIVGIGLNINQTLFPGHLRKPVSLRQITGKTFNVIDLAKELCRFVDTRWNQLGTNNFNTLLEEYCSRLYKINSQAVFKKDNAEFTAIIKGVNKRGQLIIQAGGEQLFVAHGDVEWVLPN